ncbi:MAG: protein-L-isoaspartate O-methyltransferase [Actinomycetota bacterium]
MAACDEQPSAVDTAASAMIERLRAEAVLTSASVEQAFRSVPRHLFVDGVSIAAAYAETAVVVKVDRSGTALSSISQPAIVAAMLELLQLERGHRVMEVGTGTGYNAALLSYLVGTSGLVVTIELEDDLVAAARLRLQRNGFHAVQIVAGDGAEGHATAAPYDRVIVTTGATEVAPAWVAQLDDGGRLVTPVVDSSGIGMIHCYVKRGSAVERIATQPCGFLPMRSRPKDPG